MQKEVKFQAEEFVPAWASNYSEKKFTVFSTCFLSTKKNSHELNISEEVLRRDAKTILGNFLVAKVEFGDARSHEMDEIIYGFFPTEQEIEFKEVEEDGEKIVKACAYCVVSKVYGSDFNEIFSYNNFRDTSVEMSVTTAEDDEHDVLDFDIYGLTCLGNSVRGSCPDANMKMVRFSKEEAEDFFKGSKPKESKLQKFIEERRVLMADEKYVNHPIDTSKKAIYEGEWDGQKAKQDLVKEKNFKTLAPKVCMRLEDGWENREVTKLGYPVMMLVDGKWVYSRRGLASALGYAEKEDDTEVVEKIRKIYKSLDLDQDGKEEKTKMAEKVEHMEIEGRKAWGVVIQKVKDHEGEGVYVDSIEKDHIIYTKGDVRYRVEADVKVGPDDDDVDVRIDWNTVKKDADQKMSEDEEEKDEEEVEMSMEEMKAKCAKLEADIADRDNIIMDKDKKMGEMEAELATLRDYKNACEQKELATSVETIMAEVKDCMGDDKYKEFRDEGLTCKMSELDGWSNKVKAFAFENGKGKTKKQSDVWSFGAPIESTPKQKSLWD